MDEYNKTCADWVDQVYRPWYEANQAPAEINDGHTKLGGAQTNSGGHGSLPPPPPVIDPNG